MRLTVILAALTLLTGLAAPLRAQYAIKGQMVYTMAGPPIKNGVVVIREGKIAAVGEASRVTIPSGFTVLEAAVVTPGLVDARATVGLAGIYNDPGHDQDQLEKSSPIQPELRALDAYNPQEKLIEYVRGFGVTTVNTGHAPGKLSSGQTVIVKTVGKTVEEALVQETGVVAADLSSGGLESGKAPGTRAKMISLLRQQFIKAQEALSRAKTAAGDDKKEAREPARDLRQEMFERLLKREVPLLITVHRAQDIAGALRLQKEFGFRLILDGASEAPLLLDEIKQAGVPVILHPTMQRTYGDTQSLSFETAAKLKKAGVPFALQTGYEGYVPRVRVLLFEAAIAAANGLSPEEALAAITLEPARILGIEKRVGSLEAGKDADLALFDGDPFEYTSHCIGVLIEGKVVSSNRN